MFLISFWIGFIIVVTALLIMRMEFNRALQVKSQLLYDLQNHRADHIPDLVEGMGQSIDEMNRAFYDIVNDLEGNHSVLEKETTMIYTEVDQLKRQVLNLERHLKALDLASQNLTSQAKPLSPKKEEKVHEIKRTVENGNHTDFVKATLSLEEKMLLDYENGESIKSIAKKYNKGIGEVSLFFSLYKEKNN